MAETGWRRTLNHDIALVTARNHVDYSIDGEASYADGVASTEYEIEGDIQWESGSPTILFVPGIRGTYLNSVYPVKSAFRYGGYTGEFSAYIWDGASDGMEWSEKGEVAKLNGPKLGQFIADYKKRSGGEDLFLLAFSTGSIVVCEALRWLHQESELTDVEGVIFWAGSVDVGLFINRYQDAIEHRTEDLLSYYSLNDDILGLLKASTESITPVGAVSIEESNFSMPDGCSERLDDASHHDYIQDPEYCLEALDVWGIDAESSASDIDDGSNITDSSAESQSVLTAIRQKFRSIADLLF